MSTTKTFSFDRLIDPKSKSSTLIRYTPGSTNLSAASKDPRNKGLSQYFINFSPTPFYVPKITRLEWSPIFGAYVYWTDGIDFTGNEDYMSYDEFGGVDKALVVSLVPPGDYNGRYGQISSLTGFNNYPNLQYLSVGYNRNLKSLDLSSVNNLKQFYSEGCDFSEGINFSNQSQLEELQIYYSNINSISLPAQPNLVYISIESTINLESINIPGSGSIDGTIDIYYNSRLNSITVPLNTTNNLQWYHNALTNVDVSRSPLLTTLNVSNNFLTSLKFDECPYLKNIYANENILSTTMVDNIFISASNAADTYSLNEGNIYLNGSNGLPSSASLSARNNLISRDWNVSYAEYVSLYYSPNATDPNLSAWTYTTASNGAGDGSDPVIYTDGNSTFVTPNIKTLSVDGLSEIDGFFYLDGDTATQQTLESVNFNNLANLGDNTSGEFYITNCRKLTSISVTDCPSITEAYLYDNYELTSINLSGSTNIVILDVDYCLNLTNLDLSQLPNLQAFDGYNTFSITSYDFTNNPLLTNIQVGSGGGGGQLFSNLESVDCSGLSNLSSIDVSSNPKLTTLNLSGSNSLDTIYVGYGCGLTTIDLSAQTSLINLYGNYGKLSSIEIPLTNTLTYVNLYDNQLSVGEVNKVLHFLASGSAENGYVSLEGEFIPGVIQNGIPDTTSGGYNGLAAIDTLVGRGWSVYYNS